MAGRCREKKPNTHRWDGAPCVHSLTSNATQAPSWYGHMAKVSRPLSMGAWQYAEGRCRNARDKMETRKGHPGVESVVQRPSRLTPMHKPPGSVLVSSGFFPFLILYVHSFQFWSNLREYHSITQYHGAGKR